MFKTSQIKTSNLQPNKLKKFLKKFKVYPEKHRLMIWKQLLQLPDNYEAFENLISIITNLLIKS